MGGEERAGKERSMAAAFASATGTSAAGCGVVWSILLLGTMLATNMLALYSLSISRDLQQRGLEVPSSPSILRELASIKEELRKTQDSISKLQGTVTSNSVGSKLSQSGGTADHSSADHVNSPELMQYTAERKLPLGRNPNYGLETMVSPVGHQCYLHQDLLRTYMNYTPGELCPDDWSLAQSLMVRGCEPLPRRRCFARTPPTVTEPSPLPASLWKPGRDGSVLWTHYNCKSYECLQNRAKDKSVFYDCADCFDLTGPESSRWVNARDFMSLEELLELKRGSIRIGLDIGGGSGSFAARMWEHNVTIITTTLNLNGPFNEFVASRGLVPVFATISQRLPFFDNTLDLVHTMHVLSNWLPLESLEFVLFDIDRVLRPGGLFWLDHFFCTESQLDGVYVPLIRRLRFREVKWVVGKKLDRNGVLNKEVYLSALLEKPVRS